jgi:molecular chaperone DnaJ
MTGEGEPGQGGGPRGDLFIYVEVEPEEIFRREGNDIVCEVPLGFPQATLGTTIRVPTLNGEAELKIPAGTQSGTVFRLRNLGMPDLRGYSQGDQLIRVVMETPARVSREQKDLLKRFDELSDVKTYPLHRRFMDTLKKSFGG